MPFSFLNPWMWLGLLAVAAPIWLHLRRKEETNLLPFSALRFLDDLPAPRRSPLRLQNLLLFAMRVLALLAVAAAFAWPYRQGEVPDAVEESRVYILDNSLSHQSKNGFQRHRDRVAEEMAQGRGTIQRAVIELTSQPRVVARFSDEPASARKVLLGLEPSYQRGSYLAAFREANALLENSLGSRKRIIFLGDNQENQWAEHLNVPPFLGSASVEIPDAPAEAAPNVALAEPRLQRLFLGDQSLVGFSVKLSHTGDTPQVMLKIALDGQGILERTLDLAGQPPTILIQTEWTADPARWISGNVSVEGSPDALEGDNQAFFSLPPVREGKILLLASSPYLRLALSPDIMRGHWSTRILEPSELSAELADGADADALCLESHYLQSSDARQLVWRYLTNGRGVVLLINRVTPVVTGALRELGFETLSSVKITAEAQQTFRYVYPNHPIFHPFLASGHGNLMEVRIFEHARLKAQNAMPLIFAESGDALFFESTKFPGKLLVAAFGLDREATSWPTHGTFVPFLDLCLQHARVADTTPTEFEPGQACVIELPPDAPPGEVVLRDSSDQTWPAQIRQGRAQWTMPDRPGLYSVSYGAALEPAMILAVNPSPKESELRYMAAPAALDVWRLGAETARPQPVVLPLSEAAVAAIQRQSYWWWLLLLALAALTVEIIWTSSIFLGGRRRSYLETEK